MLTTHIVLYRDSTLKSNDTPYIFRCEADDENHAKEQCLNAEPECNIVFVKKTKHATSAYDSFYKTQ
jgi:hypothetical protein